MLESMEEHYYNPSSVYRPAVTVFGELRRAREALLAPLHGRGHELVFTSGGTESNNLAVLGAVGRMHGPQLVALSAVEHPSVKAAFEALRRAGHEVAVIPVGQDGAPDYAFLAALLDRGLSFVSCMQVNNETGALLDVKRLKDTVAGRAVIHVDGVQGYLRVPMDLTGIDLYSFSSHKIHGPKGVGALAIRKGLRIEPRQLGGGQEGEIRSGTENVPGIMGFHAAAVSMAADKLLAERLMALKLRLIRGITQGAPETLVNGPAPEAAAPHIVNISFPGVRGETMLHALEEKRVYVSTGSACSSKKLKVSGVLTAMGLSADRAQGALRFSLGALTTEDEVAYAAEQAVETYTFLKRYQRR